MKFKNFIHNEEVSIVGSTEPAEVTISNSNLSPQSSLPAALTDIIKMDVPLFIRVLEYSHENAKTDQEMHELTERAVQMGQNKILTMEDYEDLVMNLRREPDDPNAAPPKEYATMKIDPAYDSDKPTDPQKFGGGALSGM